MFWLLVVWFLFGFFGGAFFLFVLFRWLTGFPVLCIWDAQVRRHFQDCHHRHDERSNGAKKKDSSKPLLLARWFQRHYDCNDWCWEAGQGSIGFLVGL